MTIQRHHTGYSVADLFCVRSKNPRLFLNPSELKHLLRLLTKIGFMIVGEHHRGDPSQPIWSLGKYDSSDPKLGLLKLLLWVNNHPASEVYIDKTAPDKYRFSRYSNPDSITYPEDYEFTIAEAVEAGCDHAEAAVKKRISGETREWQIERMAAELLKLRKGIQFAQSLDNKIIASLDQLAQNYRRQETALIEQTALIPQKRNKLDQILNEGRQSVKEVTGVGAARD